MHLSDSGKITPVVECLIIKDNKVLLLKRSSDAKKFPGYWIGPGGHIDTNEDVLSAAIREVKEETGVTIQPSEITLKAIGVGNHTDRGETFLVFFFVAHITNDQKLTSSNEGNAEWVEIEKARKLQDVFPPFKIFFEYGLGNKPGVLYTNIEFENLQVKNIVSSQTDQDY